MKITFLRYGHSNNSSSSHSLIFTREADKLCSDESTEFGWNYFTCSDKGDKLNYVLSCLRERFDRLAEFPSLYKINDYKDEKWRSVVHEAGLDLNKIRKSLFGEWVEHYLGYKKGSYDASGYVDHQSAIFFPMDRSGEKINHEFAKDFIEQFINNDWYIYGGNDNDDSGGDPPTNDETSDCEDFRTVWNFLKDTRDIICVKDSLTNEYVLSNTDGTNYKGSILKVKF